MSRNASGTYTLPAGNPVVTATIISSTWANTTLSDLATEMTDSLDRSGKGGMLAPLQLTDGAVGAPSLTFVSETTMGVYKVASGQLGITTASTLRASINNTGNWVFANPSSGITMTVTNNLNALATPAISVQADANHSALVSLCGNASTPNSGDFVLQHSGTGVAALTNHANANMQLATNNTNRLIMTGAGDITSWENNGIGSAGLMNNATYETGSYTATAQGGFVANPSGTAFWTRVGPIVAIALPTLTGTSNGTNQVTITGLPAGMAPAKNWKTACGVEDNSVFEVGTVQLLAAGTTMSVNRTNGSSTFTNANLKGITFTSFIYSLL